MANDACYHLYTNNDADGGSRCPKCSSRVYAGFKCLGTEDIPKIKGEIERLKSVIDHLEKGRGKKSD